MPTHSVQQFDYKVISEATNNFSADAKLGEGGFGVVYKALLNGAVKLLSLVSLQRNTRTLRNKFSYAVHYRLGPEQLPVSVSMSLPPPTQT